MEALTSAAETASAVDVVADIDPSDHFQPQIVDAVAKTSKNPVATEDGSKKRKRGAAKIEFELGILHERQKGGSPVGGRPQDFLTRHPAVGLCLRHGGLSRFRAGNPMREAAWGASMAVSRRTATRPKTLTSPGRERLALGSSRLAKRLVFEAVVSY